MEFCHVFLSVFGFCILINLASSVVQNPTTTESVDEMLRSRISSLCEHWCTRATVEAACRNITSQGTCDQELPWIVDEHFCSSKTCGSGEECFTPMLFGASFDQLKAECIPSHERAAADNYAVRNTLENRRAVEVISICRERCTYQPVKNQNGIFDPALNWYFCERVNPPCKWSKCKLNITYMTSDDWEPINVTFCIPDYGSPAVTSPTTPTTSTTTSSATQTTSPTASSITRESSATTEDQNTGPNNNVTSGFSRTSTTRGPNTTATHIPTQQTEQSEDITVKAAGGAVAVLVLLVAVVAGGLYCRRKKMCVKADQQPESTIVEPPSLPPRPQVENGIPHLYRVCGEIEKKGKPSKNDKLPKRAKPNNYIKHLLSPNKTNKHFSPDNHRPHVPDNNNNTCRPKLQKAVSAPPKPTAGNNTTKRNDPRRTSNPVKKTGYNDMSDTATVYLDLKAYTPLENVPQNVKGPKLPPRIM